MVAVLTCKITNRIVPTSNLLHPTKMQYFYDGTPEIKEFETTETAEAFIEQYLPLGDYIALPGSKRGLECYQQLWIEENGECLQNIEKLNVLLHERNLINWGFYDEDATDLIESCEEFDKLINDKSGIVEYNEDGKIKNYLITEGKSKYSLFSNFMLAFELTRNLEFNDLSLEDQLKCVEPNMDGAYYIVHEMKLWDLYIEKTYKYPRLAGATISLKVAIKQMLSTAKYNIKTFFSTEIYKFNEFMVNHKFYN
jgi:hypothetical protein